MPCPLCASTDDLAPWHVAPARAGASTLQLCGACRAQLDGAEPLDPRHWNGLRETIWSDVPALQVVSWRLLKRLSDVPWARDLMEQAYLDDEVLAWAQEGLHEEAPETAAPVTDSNGARLSEGDSVTLIKDLEVKGAGFTAKRGTLVKNIHLTDDPGLVEGRVNGTVIVLKTAFLKRVA